MKKQKYYGNAIRNLLQQVQQRSSQRKSDVANLFVYCIFSGNDASIDETKHRASERDGGKCRNPLKKSSFGMLLVEMIR